MQRLTVKPNPYNAPFRPAPEPGVYWLPKEYQGDCPHDAHTVAVRIVRKMIPGSPVERPVYQSVARFSLGSQSAADVLKACGLPGLASDRRTAPAFIPNGEFLADLSRDGIKAARRALQKRGAN